MIEGMRAAGLSLQPYSGSLARSKPDAPSATFERAVVASAQSHTDAALSITTDEGDSVTISFAQDSSATYSSLVRGQRGPNGSSLTSVRTLSFEQSSQFEITVEGDLSEQEMQDIQDLVKRVGQALKSLVRGDVERAAAKLSKPGDLESLSGFQVEMAHSESISIAIAERRTIGPGSFGPPPPLDSEMLNEKPLAVRLPITQPGVEDIAEQLLDLSKQKGWRVERLEKALTHAFEGLRREHGMRGHDNSLDALERALKGRLAQTQPAEPASAPGEPIVDVFEPVTA